LICRYDRVKTRASKKSIASVTIIFTRIVDPIKSSFPKAFDCCAFSGIKYAVCADIIFTALPFFSKPFIFVSRFCSTSCSVFELSESTKEWVVKKTVFCFFFGLALLGNAFCVADFDHLTRKELNKKLIQSRKTLTNANKITQITEMTDILKDRGIAYSGTVPTRTVINTFRYTKKAESLINIQRPREKGISESKTDCSPSR